MSVDTTARSGTLAPLRYPPYRILISGRVISQLGGSVAPLALAFAVLDLTGSISDLGSIVATRTILNVLFILFGGVIADRLPRNLLMVGSSLVAGVSQGIAATLFLTHHATIPVLLVLAAINGSSSALSQPAAAALMPQTVPAEMRKQANALNRLASNTVSILGVSVAGILVAAVGSGWCVAIDASSFFVGAIFYALIRVPSVVDRSKKRPSLIVGLREGWQGFIGHTWLWVVVLGFMIFNAATAGGMGVLGPVFADLTVGRKLWGIVLGAEAVGAILGAFVAMRLKPRRLLSFGTAAVVTGALLPFALVFSPQFAVLLAASFIGGLGMEQFGIAWETTMQDNIEPDMLARVYSYDMLGSFVAIPIGQLVVGPAAAAFGPKTTMLWVGVVMVVAVVFMMASKSVRTVEHPPKVPLASHEEPPILVPVPDLGPDLLS